MKSMPSLPTVTRASKRLNHVAWNAYSLRCDSTCWRCSGGIASVQRPIICPNAVYTSPL